jgi:hypothetical protein
MKIPISHPNLKPQTNANKFTKDELKFIQLMEEDDNLEEYLESARKRAHVPPGGFNMDTPLSKYTESGEFQKMDYNIVYEQAKMIHYALYSHLPEYWITTLVPLIMLNIALPPSRFKILPIEIEATNYELKIIIRRGITKKEITDFLTENKETLEKHLAKLPKHHMPKIRVSELELYKKIRQLKKEGYSDSKIADKLDEENQNGMPTELDHAEIGVYRNRFDNYLYKYLDYNLRHKIFQEALKLAIEKLNANNAK